MLLSVTTGQTLIIFTRMNISGFASVQVIRKGFFKPRRLLMSLKQIKLFFFPVLFLFVLAACGGNPEEEARIKLGQMNVKFNEDSFVDAARNGDVIVLKYFLQAGMKPSVTDSKGETALIAGAKGGRTEVVELLLTHGADVNAKDKQFGASPLIWASISGNADTVKLLLDKGADIKATEEKNGMNALLAASVRGNMGTVKLLVDKGVDVNSRDKDGRSPLMWAAHGGQIETLKLLLDKGADPNARATKDGMTALISAASRGQTEIVKLLLDKGADIKSQDNSGKTALIWAAQTGQGETVNVLLDKGADVDAKDKDGKTALSYAQAAQKPDIEEMLLKARATPVKQEAKQEKPESATKPESENKAQ
jgi:ankyrin repeat protein